MEHISEADDIAGDADVVEICVGAAQDNAVITVSYGAAGYYKIGANSWRSINSKYRTRTAGDNAV